MIANFTVRINTTEQVNTHTHTLSQSNTHTLSQSNTHTHALSHTHTHTHTHSLSLSLSLSLTHTRRRTLPCNHLLVCVCLCSVSVCLFNLCVCVLMCVCVWQAGVDRSLLLVGFVVSFLLTLLLLSLAVVSVNLLRRRRLHSCAPHTVSSLQSQRCECVIGSGSACMDAVQL